MPSHKVTYILRLTCAVELIIVVWVDMMIDGRFDIKWDLPEEDFIADIDKKLQICETEGFRVPIPIKIDFQNPQIIHYYMQNALHCEKCDARCCLKPIEGGKANGTIKIDKNDLFNIRRRYGKPTRDRLIPLLKGVGRVRGFVPPCPYCTNNRCEIYDARPYICKIYPFGVGTGLIEGEAEHDILTIDPDCPQAVEYAKGVYLKQYRDGLKRRGNS